MKFYILVFFSIYSFLLAVPDATGFDGGLPLGRGRVLRVDDSRDDQIALINLTLELARSRPGYEHTVPLLEVLRGVMLKKRRYTSIHIGSLLVAFKKLYSAGGLTPEAESGLKELSLVVNNELLDSGRIEGGDMWRATFLTPDGEIIPPNKGKGYAKLVGAYRRSLDASVAWLRHPDSKEITSC